MIMKGKEKEYIEDIFFIQKNAQIGHLKITFRLLIKTVILKL